MRSGVVWKCVRGNKMKYAFVLFALSCMGMAACSNRSVYETIQANNRLDCQKVPVAQQEDCLRQADKSYEEYERERQELLKKDD